MVFSTFSFLFCFLPITILLYYMIQNRTWRNLILLATSLLFYAWGEPRYLVVLFGVSLVAYFSGLAMAFCEKRELYRWKKLILFCTVALLTANLFCFKYLNFTIQNINQLLHTSIPLSQLTLPLGISFFTFQIISYIVDLSHNRISAQRNFANLLLYVSLFPQLVAGPIVRYQTIADEILHRTESVQEIAAGLRRFIAGLAKKVLLADSLGAISQNIYDMGLEICGSGLYWVAALAFMLQIYFDFSGYSDMAIGLGRMFGFHFQENFDHPYLACSVTEFWRRWHISLSTWFRDYVYIPLGGNRTSKPRWFFNFIFVWVLTGFWHGAAWNFLLWGLYYAVILLVERLFLHNWLCRRPKTVGWCYTFFIVLIGWVLFYASSLDEAVEHLWGMFAFVPWDFSKMVAINVSPLLAVYILPLSLLSILPWHRCIAPSQKPSHIWLMNLAFLGLFLICVIKIAGSSYSPFLYFRF